MDYLGTPKRIRRKVKDLSSAGGGKGIDNPEL